jgi:hypothetical protein
MAGTQPARYHRSRNDEARSARGATAADGLYQLVLHNPMEVKHECKV